MTGIEAKAAARGTKSETVAQVKSRPMLALECESAPSAKETSGVWKSRRPLWAVSDHLSELLTYCRGRA